MNKKKLIIFSVIGIVLVLGCSFLYYFLNKDVKVELIDNLDVDIFGEVSNVSFVKSISKGKVITENENIDTSTLGEKKITLKLKNKFGQVSDYNFVVKIVDTESPSIECEKTIETTANEDANLLKDVKVSDNSKEKIKPSVEGSYDLSTPGEYKIYYVAKDSSGNETREEVILTVKKRPTTSSGYVMSDRTFTTSKGFNGVIKNGTLYIDGVLVANKTYSLPSSYGNGLTSETNEAFSKMKSESAKEGLNIYISSGFRSYSTQEAIYNRYVSRDGKNEADTYSARPGHSEHQTGLAFDVNDISQAFANTKEAKWLSENCYKYGFILRYPKGKTNETGYIYEPWHFRYVGSELASKLYNNGEWITLEDYFGITSEYNY